MLDKKKVLNGNIVATDDPRNLLDPGSNPSSGSNAPRTLVGSKSKVSRIVVAPRSKSPGSKLAPGITSLNLYTV